MRTLYHYSYRQQSIFIQSQIHSIRASSEKIRKSNAILPTKMTSTNITDKLNEFMSSPWFDQKTRSNQIKDVIKILQNLNWKRKLNEKLNHICGLDSQKCLRYMENQRNLLKQRIMEMIIQDGQMVLTLMEDFNQGESSPEIVDSSRSAIRALEESRHIEKPPLHKAYQLDKNIIGSKLKETDRKGSIYDKFSKKQSRVLDRNIKAINQQANRKQRQEPSQWKEAVEKVQMLSKDLQDSRRDLRESHQRMRQSDRRVIQTYSNLNEIKREKGLALNRIQTLAEQEMQNLNRRQEIDLGNRFGASSAELSRGSYSNSVGRKYKYL